MTDMPFYITAEQKKIIIPGLSEPVEVLNIHLNKEQDIFALDAAPNEMKQLSSVEGKGLFYLGTLEDMKEFHASIQRRIHSVLVSEEWNFDSVPSPDIFLHA